MCWQFNPVELPPSLFGLRQANFLSALSAVSQRELGRACYAVVGLRVRRRKSLETLLIRGMSGNTQADDRNTASA